MHICVTINTGGVVTNRTMFVVNVTAYAGYRWTSYEELIVYRAVWRVTDCTAFAHRFVLEDKRTSLLFVALEAFFILAQQAGTQQHFPSRSLHVASVHIMAVIAEHSSFRYGVMVLEHKFALDIEVAAIARCFGICPDNLALITHAFNVKAARSMAGLTGFCLASFCIFICYVDRYTCMVSELEIVGLCFMALGTRFRPDVVSTRNRWWCHDHRLVFEYTAGTNKDT
jgi:hypothetical protein